MKKVRMMRDRRGSALMVVVLFIFVLSLTGMAILYLNGRQEIAAIHDVKEVAAYQAASAGIELARAWFIYQGKTLNRFPEHINHNRNPILLFTDGTHPDGQWNLLTPVNPVLGRAYYRVTVNPSPMNDVHLNVLNATGDGEDMGNYEVVSIGTVSTGVNGTYDYVKEASAIVRVHYRTAPLPLPHGFFFRVVSNTWIEEPIRRMKRPYAGNP